MKNRRIIIVVAVLITVVAMIGLATRTGNKKNSTGQNKPVATMPTEACQLLTLDDAKNILGTSAKAATLSEGPRAHTEGTPEGVPEPNQPPTIPNITMTRCSYNAESSEGNTIKYDGINLEVRTPQNAEGVAANKTAASEFEKSGTKIEGHENAYWIADRSLLVFIQGDQLVTATRTLSMIELTGDQAEPPETKLVRATPEQSVPILDAIKTKF